MWPTPTKQDGKNNAGLSQFNRNSLPLNTAVVVAGGAQTRQIATQQQRGALNPDWVEWLMDWPIGATDLKPLGMDRFQAWLRLHSGY
jgi:hypothetical protein